MHINESIKYLGQSILIALILMVTLLLVWCLPNGLIEDNYKKSLEIFDKEGYSWEDFFDYAWGGNIDNAMDYVILSTTVPKDDRGPIYNAVYCNDYARYWHGYLLYLRPLLCFFSYAQIRYIFLMIHISMLILIYDLIRKRLGYGIAWGWVIAMILMRINVLAFSIQFSSIFFVLYGALVYLLISYKESNIMKLCYVLLLVGMLTSFVDLLTAPLITLGIPLIIVLCMNIKNKVGLRNNMISAVIGTMTWGVGYVVMWALKWPLMTIVLRTDTKSEIMAKLIERSGTQAFYVDGREIIPSFTRAVIYNVFAFIPNIFGITPEFTKANLIRLIAILMIVLCILIFFIIKIKRNSSFAGKKELLPLLMVSSFPFIWYAVIKEHSCIHQFYTYRILSIFFFALWCAVSIGASKVFLSLE